MLKLYLFPRAGTLKNVDAWAIALSEDGQYLAGVSQDGHVRVWDLNENGTQIRDHETKGSFGMCIDLVRNQYIIFIWKYVTDANSPPMENSLLVDMKMVLFICSRLKMVECHSPYLVCTYPLAARGISSGSVTDYIPGLVKPVRNVAFSPGGKILAAAGDSKVIVLYDTSSGLQIANLSGHTAWILSLSWSDSGEYLLSR